MKKTIMLLMFVVLCSFATASTWDTPDWSIYFPYDNTEIFGATNQTDVRGFNNLSCVTPTTGISGQVKQTYYFDGTNDWCYLGNEIKLEDEGFSITGWFNSSGNSVADAKFNRLIHFKNTGGSYGLFIYQGTTNNNLTFQVQDPIAGFVTIDSGIPINGSGWMFFTAVYNNTHLHLYINDTLRSSVAFSYNADWTTDKIKGVGGDDSDLTLGWEGSLDELAFFNASLSQTNITNIYQRGFNGNRLDGFDYLETSLIYPVNGTTYYDYNGSVLISLSDVNGSANCSLNDTRWSFASNDNSTYAFINNTVITDENVSISYYCNDTGGNWSNGTGIWFNKENTLNINIYSVDTGNLINTSLVDITIYNNAYYNSSFSTTNGTTTILGLSNGSYTVALSSDNYTSASYTVSMGFGETTTLNAYLINTTNSVIFTITDYDNSRPIEGATVTIMQYISDVLTVTNVLESDVTGRVQFNYEEDTFYSFIVSASGYIDKPFTLNPIVYSTYTIRLEPIESVDDDSIFTGVNMYHSPTLFYEGANVYTFTIVQPEGQLQFYGTNLSYPGGTNVSTGTNAYGQTIRVYFNITGAVFGDRINITNYYRLDDGNFKYINYVYDIIPEPRNYTFMYNSNRDYGLGDFERGFISTFISLGVGGFAGIFIGYIGGLAISLMIFGYLAYTGFISYWLLVIPIFGGTLIIIWGSSK